VDTEQTRPFQNRAHPGIPSGIIPERQLDLGTICKVMQETAAPFRVPGSPEEKLISRTEELS